MTYESPSAPWIRRRVGRRRNSGRLRPGSFRCNRVRAPPGWPSVGGIRSSRFEALPPASASPGRPSAATRDSTISSIPTSDRCLW